MGRQLTDDQLKWTLDINGDPARKELGELNQTTRQMEKDNKDLRLELKKMESQGKKNTKEYKALKSELAKNNQQVVQNKAKMAEYRKQIGITGLTIRELGSEQKRLRNLLNNTVPGTPKFKEYEKQLKRVSDRQRQLQGGLKKTNKFFGLLKSALPIIGIGALVAILGRAGKELFNIGKQMQGESRKHAIVLGEAYRGTVRSITTRAGADVAASRMKIATPAVRLNVSPIEVPSEEEATYTLTGMARQDAAPADELVLTFD